MEGEKATLGAAVLKKQFIKASAQCTRGFKVANKRIKMGDL